MKDCEFCGEKMKNKKTCYFKTHIVCPDCFERNSDEWRLKRYRERERLNKIMKIRLLARLR